MRAPQFTGILVLDIGRLLQRVGGAAHTTSRRRGFSSRNGHSKIILEPAQPLSAALILRAGLWRAYRAWDPARLGGNLPFCAWIKASSRDPVQAAGLHLPGAQDIFG